MWQARPFPYDRLPRLSRADLNMLRRCARVLQNDRLASIAESVTEWLGARVELEESLPLVHSTRFAAIDAICAALIELPSSAPIAIEIEPRFAMIIIDRVLGGTGENLPPHPGVLTDVERGILAYAIARALTNTTPGSMRLAGIVTSPAALAMVLGEEGLVCWPAQVQIGSDTGLLRAWIPERALSEASFASVGPLAGWLPSISLPVWVEAGRASLPASEVSTLDLGDIVVLDEASTRDVVVRARGGPAWRCTIESDRWVVRTYEPGRPMNPVKRERWMSMSDEGRDHAAQVLQSMGDAPIELVVELARFEMPLGELAALRPGEVLSTGRAIGERVILRAGERLIAQGELVDVEGEIGVRLLSLAGC